ncbi:hypothetical protein BGZ75_005148 [Mortierella antarctica]|nr:hypothetical protein BGZ75_005148 [Mortierella antarctica]
MDESATLLQGTVEEAQAIAAAAALQQEQQQQLQHRPSQPGSDEQQAADEQPTLEPGHEQLDHATKVNEEKEALEAALAASESEKLILDHATGSLLVHHEQLSVATDSVTVQALENTSSSSHIHDHHAHAQPTTSTSTHAISPETLDSVMATAVAAASNSVNTNLNGSAPASSQVSSPSVVAMAQLAPGAMVVTAAPGSSSSSSNGAGNSSALHASGSGYSNDRYDRCPMYIKLPANEWETWLEGEKVHCRWNLIRYRHRDQQTFARGPTASEWTREFQCDHAGHYRDRKDPNIDPSKKRKRTGSIKCNCPAFIKMRKQFQDDSVVIEYFWRHEGHTPDVMEDIKAHRLPQDLKAWIKRRAMEGHDWKSMKAMMTSGSPLLDELHPASKQNVKLLLPACYGQYANIARQLKRGKSRPESSQTPERSTRGGTLMQFGNEDSEMPQARGDSRPSSPKTTSGAMAAASSSSSASASQDQSHEEPV